MTQESSHIADPGEQSKAASFGLPLGIVCLLVLAIYSHDAGDFFFHDSATAIEENTAIRITGTAMDEWRRAALSTESGPLGRPVSMLSFAADHVGAGATDARQIRISNALIHILTGLFLWRFLLTVFSSSPILRWDERHAAMVAAAAAALWLLHPLHVSTVLYTVQRMTQLATLFSLAGLWWVFRLRCRWLQRAPDINDYSQAFFILALFTALATLSKESGLLVPLLAAATELSLFRFRVAGGRSTLLRVLAPASLLATLFALLALFFAEPAWLLELYVNRDFDLAERMLTQLRLLWHYLGWTLYPDITAMGFHHDGFARSSSLFAPVTTLVAALSWVLALGLAWALRDRLPLLGFGLLWFLAGHSMESSALPLEMVYEHRNYLPSLGPLALLAGLLLVSPEKFRGYGVLAVSVLLLALLALLFFRSASWANEKSLAEFNYRNHPQSVKTRLQLATAYYEIAQSAADPESAQQFLLASRELLLQTAELDPLYVPALALLIYVDSHSSDTSSVAEWYARLDQALARPSLHISAVKFIAFQNRCVVRGDCVPPEAGQRELLSAAAERHPRHVHLLYQLAYYCFATGDLACARIQSEKLLAQEPRFTAAQQLIYAIELREGRGGRAMETVRHMLLLDEARRLPGKLLRATAEKGAR